MKKLFTKKKLFAILLVFVLSFSFFTLSAFAEEVQETPETELTEPEQITDTEETPTDTPEDTGKLATTAKEGIIDQILAIVTNAEIWAKIGATTLGVLALIVTIRSTLNKITTGIVALRDLIRGNATKEESEKIIKDSFTEVKAVYEEKHAELTDKYNQLLTKYDKQTAVLSLMVLQLVKSPNARTHIMSLITDTKELGGEVMDIVTDIEKIIEEEDAAEPKPDTPALDSIAESVALAEDNVIRLG